MYPDEPYYLAPQRAEYAPYFYQAGLFARYLVPAVQARLHPQSTLPVLLNDPWLDAAGPRAGPVQTVEEVIARGYFAVPNANPITALVTDRLHSSKLGLDDVIHQIRSRYEIYQRNIEELHESVCEAQNAVFRQLADHGMLVANQRQQYSATKQIQKLYEQQREERINLWRDVSRLKLTLPETVQQYLGSYRKAAILRESPDGGGDVT